MAAFSLIGAFTAPVAHAAVGVNQQINFQARLLNAAGATVPDGNYNVEFRIYQDGTGCVSSGSSPCGGTLKWTEDWLNSNTQPVVVKNGYMSIYLGAGNDPLGSLASTVDFNQDTLWLSLNIGNTGACTITTNFTANCAGDGEMLPFKRFAATPYALNSGSLGGKSSTQFVQLAQGLQTDSSTTNASIAINKTGTTANILDLQRAAASVFLIDNNGTATLQTTGDTSSLLVKQSATAAPTADIFDVLGANGTTKFISVTSTAANAGTVTVQSVGAANALTLNSGSGTIVLGGATTTVQKAGASLTLDVSNGNTNSTLAVVNTGGTGVANLTVDGTIAGASTITGTTLNGTTGINTGASSGTLRLDSNGALSNITGYNQSSGTVVIGSVTTSGDIFAIANTSLNTSGANLANLTVKNNNTGAAGLTVNGLTLTPTNSTPTSGNNTLNALNLAAVTSVANQVFNGLNIGANYTNALVVAGTAIINGSGLVQSAGISGTYGNLTGTGALASGSLTTGFTAVNVAQGGTGAATLTANGILQGNGTGAVTAISPGGAGTVLLSNGTTASFTTITNASLTSGSYTNITDVGTLASGLNIASGQTYKINSADINTAGTLSNVAYKNASNTFTGANNTFKNSSDSATALQVQNAGGQNIINIDTSGGNANNLIGNPSIESAIAASAGNWQLKGSAAVTQNNTQAYVGANSLKIVTTALANDGAKQQLASTLAVSSKFSASFYVKLDSASNFTAAAATGMTTLAAGYSSTGASDDTPCTLNTSTVLPNAWTKVTCNFTTPATTSSSNYFYVKQTDAKIYTMYVDGVLLQTDANTESNYREGKVNIQGTVVSPLILQNSSNSSGALVVQDIRGTNVFSVDTTDTNLITNPGFEQGIVGWAVEQGTGSINRDNSQSWLGNSSMNVTTSSTANAGAKFTTGNAQPTQLAVSSTYTLSWYAKLSAGTFTDILCRYSVDGGTTFINGTMSTQTVSLSGWTRYSCVINTAATAPSSTAYIAIVQTATGTARTFWVDGVQLEGGGTATAYGAGSFFLNGAIISPVTFKNQANSTTAFQIQRQNGASLLFADTLNNLVEFGGSIDISGTAAPALSDVGQSRIYYDTTLNRLQISNNGGAFQEIGDASVARLSAICNIATVTETSLLIGTNTGCTGSSYSIPANTIANQPGKTYGIFIAGFASTPTGGGTLTFKIKYAGSALPCNVVSNASTTAATGSFSAVAAIEFYSATAAVCTLTLSETYNTTLAEQYKQTTSSATTAVTTTANALIDLSITESAATFSVKPAIGLVEVR